MRKATILKLQLEEESKARSAAENCKHEATMQIRVGSTKARQCEDCDAVLPEKK